MVQNQNSQTNVVSLFFGMATAAVLITVLIAALFFNQLPQPQPTDPAVLAQSQQPGYSYSEVAATQTVHNKASLLLVAVGSMAVVMTIGMMIFSGLSNRQAARQVVQIDQPQTSNITLAKSNRLRL